MSRWILEAEDSSLETAAETYLRVGCAVADAFIQCWRTKYQWNLLRPVTYIRANIDPEWNSLVTTPPFPEYSSGHSTQSAAWAEVMTAMFGDGYQFTDHTHDDLGLPPRTFISFRHAAEEAAVSRLYGGIHYRFGNENGLAAGICTGTAAAQLPLRS
jgi:membrane-associated phospholipid phosphatase